MNYEQSLDWSDHVEILVEAIAKSMVGLYYTYLAVGITSALNTMELSPPSIPSFQQAHCKRTVLVRL